MEGGPVGKNERPRWSEERAADVLAESWGLSGTLTELPSDRDQNFRVDADGPSRFVFKIARSDVNGPLLEAQGAMVDHLRKHAPDVRCPRVIPDRDGRSLVLVDGDGSANIVRLLSWVEGTPLADRPRPVGTLRDLGRLMGTVSGALAGFDHPALHRALPWDLARGVETASSHLGEITPGRDRALVKDALGRFADEWGPLLQHLPRQALHNDANDHNVIVERDDGGGDAVRGLIDFGDIVHSYRIAELAIAATYGLLGSADPVGCVAQVAAGFAVETRLQDLEVRLLLPLVELRLLVSVTMSAYQRSREPDVEYLSVSEDGAWVALRQLSLVDRDRAEDQVRQTLGLPTQRPRPVPRNAAKSLAQARKATLIPSLSLSYDEPLHIVRGFGTRLYDTAGRAYLDCVNNVCHVGHSHPTVVRAINQQARLLNTNSRYLHEHVVEYARQLAGTLPERLEVCAFVSSGSEANELALRMARVYTGRSDVVVLEGGYHGNTTTLVAASSYKFDGPGGPGQAEWVHVAPRPDTYRGRFREPPMDPRDAATAYADGVREALLRAERGGGAAAFLVEAIMSCGGQIVPPAGYLAEAYAAARDAGALCIADEVQTGFGRVGEGFWAFEAEEVTPDIVTMGKPIGNGHPIGAVVTTRAIADAFANGMEYFATFGGNPVSCAAGLAVLDVIEREGLQTNAKQVGHYLKSRLEDLATLHAGLGQVRGRGLFLGVEFVSDEASRTPDAGTAHRVVQECRAAGVLLSTDGPDHNVIKIKPPLPFSHADADELVAAMEEAMNGRE